MKLFLTFVFTFLFTLSSFSQDSTFVFKRQLGLSLESGFINNRGKFIGNNYEIGGWYEERFNAGFALVFDLAARYKVLEDRRSSVRDRELSNDTLFVSHFYNVDRSGLKMAASINAKIYYSNTKKVAVFMLLGLGVEQRLLQKNKPEYVKTSYRESLLIGGNVTEVIEQNVSTSFPDGFNRGFGPEILCGLGLGYKKTNLEASLTLGWADTNSISYYYGFKLSRHITDFKKKTD